MHAIGADATIGCQREAPYEYLRRMHPNLMNQFPKIGALYRASDPKNPDNYFGIYTKPELHSATRQQFERWEEKLGKLDDRSFATFLRKTKGRVSAVADKRRGWNALIESMNEVDAYCHAIKLGFPRARLIDESHESLPDIEAVNSHGVCLVEAKTINESQAELQRRGKIQRGKLELPRRLERLIRLSYKNARKQIFGHSQSSTARKICYLVINLDLSTVLERRNQQLLDQLIMSIQTDVEIEALSRTWPAD